MMSEQQDKAIYDMIAWMHYFMKEDNHNLSEEDITTLNFIMGFLQGMRDNLKELIANG